MAIELTREKREIILKWLKLGCINTQDLFWLEPSPYENATEEEIEAESKRLSALIYSEYCSHMKLTGRCHLYNPKHDGSQR